MKQLTYSGKLRDPRWQKKRLKVFNRDEWTCKMCGDTETELQVHHLKYTGEPHEAPLKDLKTVCKHCHLIISQYSNYDIISIEKIAQPDKYKFFIVLFKDGTLLILLMDSENTIIKDMSFIHKSKTLEKMYKISFEYGN